MGVDERLREGLSRIPPTDPGGAYERVVEKKVHRRVMRRVHAAALTIVVIAGSAAGFAALERAFGPTTDSLAPTQSPPLSPSPEPTPSATPDGGEDIGLGYPVCDVTAVRGGFGSPGVEGMAFIASVMREGRCPELHRADQVLAVDLDGDHVVDASFEGLSCEEWCHAWAAPDVDGDGTDEILVQNIQFSVAGLHLYDVIGEPPHIVAVTVGPPGDPDTFDAGEQPQLWYGGDGFGADNLECVGAGSARVIVSSTANQEPPESGPWRVHETTFRLVDGILEVTGTRDYDFDGYPFERVDGICGARNPYRSG